MKNLLKTMILTTALATSSFAGGGGDILRGSFVADNLEMQVSEQRAMAWDVYTFIGYDIDKIYVYSEGSRTSQDFSAGNGADEYTTESENQLVYSRAIAPYWDIQLGIAYDRVEDADKTWGLIAIQGLAPYFFETRATVLVDEDGNIGIKASAEYEALITQKLILTPNMDIAAYSDDTVEMGLGKGFSNLTLGARMRYEIQREIAPYIGVEWSKNFGNTDKLEQVDTIYATLGLRLWF